MGQIPALLARQLRGALHTDAAARAVIEWMLSEEVQTALPESMYVFPVRGGVELPADWAQFAPRPEEPLAVDPADIEANRDTWLREWQDLVSR